MRPPRPDIVTPFEKELMDEFDDALVENEQIRVLITYKRFKSSSYDAETGVQTATTEDATKIPAIRGVVSAKQAAVNLDLEAGDRQYLIRTAILESDGVTLPLTKEDQVVEDGVTYQVISWDRDEKVGDMVQVTAREV